MVSKLLINSIANCYPPSAMVLLFWFRFILCPRATIAAFMDDVYRCEQQVETSGRLVQQEREICDRVIFSGYQFRFILDL
jgi:hypothetical protein